MSTLLNPNIFNFGYNWSLRFLLNGMSQPSSFLVKEETAKNSTIAPFMQQYGFGVSLKTPSFNTSTGGGGTGGNGLPKLSLKERFNASKGGLAANFGAGMLALSYDLIPSADKVHNSNDLLGADIRKTASTALLLSGGLASVIGAGLMAIDKTGGFTDASKGLGKGRDALNTIASFALPGAGWFTKKTDSYEMSDELRSSSSYTGTAAKGEVAMQNANAKILFGRGKANRMIRNANTRDNMVQDILHNADDRFTAATWQGNTYRNWMELNGGMERMHIGRSGLKLPDKDDLKKVRSILAKGGKLEESEYTIEGELPVTGEGIDSFQKGGLPKYKNLLKCNTKQCAKFSNGTLRDVGYLIRGDAWNLKNVDVLYSGYKTDDYPTKWDLSAVEKYNADAADDFYKNFDSKTLNKNDIYVVNMFYKGSHAQKEAYDENEDKVTGTHTGYVAWNGDKNIWEIIHNIGGTIHIDPFTKTQGSNRDYGVTTIYKPRERSFFNSIKDILGLGEGGIIKEPEYIIEGELPVIELQVDSFKKGGKPKKIKSDLSYYDPETDTIYYSGEKRKDRKEAYKHEYVHSRPNEYSELFDYLKPYYENLNDDKISELGGNLEFVKRINGDPNHFYNPEELVARMVAASYRTRNVPEYSEEFFEDLRLDENKYGDNMRDLLHMYNNKNLSLMFKYFRKPVSEGFGGGGFYRDPKGEIGNGMSLRPTGEYAPDGLEYYVSPSGDRYTLQPQAFKQGGQMNLIPEGALHARLHHMEDAEDLTKKGIPVVDNDGEQLAEIECNEIIFRKEVTLKLEELMRDGSDKAAIEAGKLLVEEIFENTDDRTGLIASIIGEEPTEEEELLSKMEGGGKFEFDGKLVIEEISSLSPEKFDELKHILKSLNHD